MEKSNSCSKLPTSFREQDAIAEWFKSDHAQRSQRSVQAGLASFGSSFTGAHLATFDAGPHQFVTFCWQMHHFLLDASFMNKCSIERTKMGDINGY